MTTVVRVDALRKSYGSRHAVRGVGFTVEQGEIFGILGPNGAGKTTTVEALAGLRHADGGTVSVLGIDPQRDPAAIKEVLGVQLQEARLPDRITVSEALRLYASFYPAPADTDELITGLGLAEHRDTRFAKLSGGLRQRLSIALALVGNPRVAILDELTTGLDPQARRAVWDVVERVRAGGVTIILVTHFMDEAERLCDRLVIIDKGKVVAEGAPAELIRGAEGERVFRMRLPVPFDQVRDRLQDLADVDTLTTVADEVEVRGGAHALPAVVLSLAEAAVVPDGIRTLSRSLEDVFVEVTGHSPEPVEVSA
ncbi:ABC-2 type transport system ATP-binding protein [Murinocardiopsis flavida]|uniref:ABC-2 type transport system ATP-binding protein n=1 Tax=Murinocardiopsis flavida TaxID=645275 RepID=A0A2P8DQB0_9ACTN|nr:ABC transporter ATP-binding protein [Murinocardiopsis flavida]PSK99382.1 ABC-2 type transport system ATP-binding protein [Murinocardiopsis flavida]